MSKFLNFDSVLCLSPHPDDVELSMFGTIEKFPMTEFNIICCSFGTQSDKSSNSLRHNEIKDFWKDSRLKNVNLFFIEDFITNKHEDQWVSIIEHAYAGILEKAQCLCTTSELDSHFEHHIISRIGMALTRYRPLSLIQYKSGSTLDEWIPNLYIDIDNYYDHKIGLLLGIRSQSHKIGFSRKVLDAVHTHMFCAKKMMGMVEMYKITSLYG